MHYMDPHLFKRPGTLQVARSPSFRTMAATAGLRRFCTPPPAAPTFLVSDRATLHEIFCTQRPALPAWPACVASKDACCMAPTCALAATVPCQSCACLWSHPVALARVHSKYASPALQALQLCSAML